MKRSHALALSGAALLLTISAPSHAQIMRTGQQCEPAVANPVMYRNCRLHIVNGNEVCRCAVLPQALRRTDRLSDRDTRDVIGTGSIGTPGVGRSDQRSPISDRSGMVVDSRSDGAVGGAIGSGGSVSAGDNTGGGGAVGRSGGTGGGGTPGGDTGAGGNTGSGGTIGAGGNFGSGNVGTDPSGRGNNGNHGGHGNNGFGNGGNDGSPNGKQDNTR